MPKGEKREPKAKGPHPPPISKLSVEYFSISILLVSYCVQKRGEKVVFQK
jgi:hypothetical protein